MSKQLSEQDLQDLFQKHLPTEPMPPGLAESLQQRVLAEVASTLRSDASFITARESDAVHQNDGVRQPPAVRKARAEQQPSLLTRLFGQLPSFQFGPSLAVIGAAAAVLLIFLNYNLPGVDDPRGLPTTETAGQVDTATVDELTVVVKPTSTPTHTATVTTILEPTNTPELEPVDVVESDEAVETEATATPAAIAPVVTTIDQSAENEDAPSTEPATDEVVQTDENRSPVETSENGGDSSGTEQPIDSAGITTATITNNTAGVNNAADTSSEESVTGESVTGESVTGESVTRGASPSATLTATPNSIAQAATASPTDTAVPTDTPTNTPTTAPTATNDLNEDDINGATAVPADPTAAPTATQVKSSTATALPINTPKPTDTRTPAPTATNVPPTATAVQSIASPTPVPAVTSTATEETVVAVPVPADTETPVATDTSTVEAETPTDTPVVVDTNTPVPSPTDMDTPVPATPTDTPVPADTDTPVPATSTDTPVPADTDTPVPATSTDTPVPADTDTPVPATSTNTPTPTNTNTAVPATPTSTAIPAPANRPPVAAEDVGTTEEDAPLTINVLSNDSDPDGDALTLIGIAGAPVNGNVEYDAEGQIIYTPSENHFGDDIIMYEVSDGNGETVSGFVKISVTEVNDPPVARTDNVTFNEDAGTQQIAVLENDSDIENDALTLLEALSAEHGEVSVDGDVVLYTPHADYNGSDTIVYRVSDSREAEATGTITIDIIAMNDAPVAKPDAISVTEDGSGIFTLLDNDGDIDSGDSLHILGVSGSASDYVDIVEDGKAISYTPRPDFYGTDVFTYTITDGTISTDARVDVTVVAVNDAPTVVDDELSAVEDTVLLITPLDNDGDIDTDGSALTIVNVSDVLNGTVTIKDGVVAEFTPNENYNGVGGFNYTISDGEFEVSGTVTVDIASVNDAPVLLSNNTYTLTEGSDVTVTILAPTLVSDVDGDPLSAAIVGPPEHAEAFSIELEEDSWKLYYQAKLGYAGPDSLTYDVVDGQGGVLTVVQQFVVRADQPPVLATDRTATGDEDGSVEVDLLEGASDPEGAPLSIVTFAAETANGSVVEVDGSIVRYTPNSDFNGEDTLNFTVSDGKQTVDGSILIQVNPVPDLPLITSAPILAATQGVTYTYDFVVSDVDGDTPISVKSDTLPAWLTIKGNSQLTGTPGPLDVGEHTIALVAIDNTGDRSLPQEFVIVVENVNDAPTVALAPKDTDGNLEGETIGFEVNISDPDEDDSHTIDVTLNSGSGSYELIDNQADDRYAELMITPELGVENVGGTIRVTDSFGAFAEQLFSVAVTPLPTPEVTATSIPTATIVPTTTVVPTATVAPTVTATVTVPIDTDVSASSVPVTSTAPITVSVGITPTVPGTGE